MDEIETADREPLMQRLLDRPLILLVLGLAVMFLFYTGWGAAELYLLPEAKLP